MFSFSLNELKNVSDAGKWCLTNLSEKNWDLKIQNIISNNPIYIFSFKEEKDAIVFALKWAS